MSGISRPAARCCTCAYQTVLRTSVQRTSRNTPVILQRQSTQSRRWQSDNASAATASNPKIANIVDQIGQLTLLETADLVSSLKSRLNIPDMPIGNFAAGPAQGQATAALAVEEEEDAAPKAQEKTLFNLTLKSFDASAKPKVIKEIKSLLNLSLVESKKFVESAPKQMRENVSKEEAEKIIEALKAVGAEVTMD